MHKVSRLLLVAGVLAFGTLASACGDSTVVPVNPIVATPTVTGVTLTPTTANLTVGQSITLAVSVSGDASAVKTVSYTSSNAAVATVDATGKVTAVAPGSVTITATSTANTSVAAAAFITVAAGQVTTPPSISISSVTDLATNNPVNLGNVNGQINVTVNVSNTAGAGTIEIFLSNNCTSNTISATDVAVATQQTAAGQNGPVTLSINTAQLTAANQARFANGNYCIKSRLTNGSAVVVASNLTALTLNNNNQFSATFAFVTKTGGPTSAVSSLNGLNYNQGELSVTITPIIFTGTAPAALVTGYLTRNGEQLGGASPGNAVFTNQAVATATNSSTIVFTDTAQSVTPGTTVGGIGTRSISFYQSLANGDTLYITAITDAAGNPIPVAPTAGFNGFQVSNFRGVRIDNDYPTLNTAYAIIAPNGYIPNNYAFASGSTGTASTDTKAGVQGVGGVTTQYYIGTTAGPAFTSGTSCSITGLAAVTNTNDPTLANTTSNTQDQAKVVVKDALGNQICVNVASTFPGGLFGIDKIAPTALFTTTSNGVNPGAADVTGYNTAARNFNLTFSDSISGFPQQAGVSPFRGTLRRIPAAGTSVFSVDCVIGNPGTGGSPACQDTVISTATAASYAETTTSTGNIIGGFQLTNGTGVVGYYVATLTPRDIAGNSGTTLTRTAAFDNVAPTVGAPTAPAVTPLQSATVTAIATDNLNLTTSRGNLIYPALVTFARVSGNVLGTFGQFVQSAAATVTLPLVYRGMQDGGSATPCTVSNGPPAASSCTATGTISGAIVAPTATITVTDVGTTSTTSAPTTLTTTTAATAVFAGQTDRLTISAANGTAGSSVATANLSYQIDGLSSDPNFQSQPFVAVDFYKLSVSGTNEYTLVQSVTAASTIDNTSTGVRTVTYTLTGTPLTQGPVASGNNGTNTFIAIGRTVNGDAVRSPSVTQNNP